MTKKIITVFGATGTQGGSVVDVFLQDPKLKDEWKVRGVTRDVSKPSSKKLEERGVEVVAVSQKTSLFIFRRIRVCKNGISNGQFANRPTWKTSRPW